MKPFPLFLVFASFATLFAGCTSTSIPDNFKLGADKIARLKKTNWQIESVQGSFRDSDNKWIRRLAENKLATVSDNTLTPIPVTVNIEYSEGEKSFVNWTLFPGAFTALTFPIIGSKSDSYSIRTTTRADSDSASGIVTENECLSWVVFPFGIVYAAIFGEPFEPIDILPDAIVAQLTPERYERNVEYLEQQRIAAEEFMAEAERIAAAKRAEEERDAAAKRAEEARLAAEQRAEKKRQEEERIAWLNDLSNKFPLRECFPSEVPVYKEFHSGCSLAWARRYMEQEKFRRIKDQPRFLRLTGGLGVSERPVQEMTSDGGTEASCFVWNPENITFSDENRIVTLTFGDVLHESGSAEKVLVGGELFFEDGSIPDSALVGKYRKVEPSATTKTSEKNVSDFGVSARLRFTEIRSNNVAIKICTVLDAVSKAERSESMTESAVEMVSGRDSNLYDAGVSAATIAVAIGIDALVAGKQDERRRENLDYWRDLRDKPIVSILDIPLFGAMAAAKDAENRKQEAQRRAREAAAEEAKRQELNRKLDSF